MIDDSVIVGMIDEVNKNNFFAKFKKKNGDVLLLDQKKKKLSLQQRELVVVGQLLKLDFETNKLYFLKGLDQWI